MKLELLQMGAYRSSRSPCGERGLKCLTVLSSSAGIPSLPVRGAWIEIIRAYPHGTTCPVAPRAGSVD